MQHAALQFSGSGVRPRPAAVQRQQRRLIFAALQQPAFLCRDRQHPAIQRRAAAVAAASGAAAASGSSGSGEAGAVVPQQQQQQQPKPAAAAAAGQDPFATPAVAGALYGSLTAGLAAAGLLLGLLGPQIAAVCLNLKFTSAAAAGTLVACFGAALLRAASVCWCIKVGWLVVTQAHHIGFDSTGCSTATCASISKHQPPLPLRAQGPNPPLLTPTLQPC